MIHFKLGLGSSTLYNVRSGPEGTRKTITAVLGVPTRVPFLSRGVNSIVIESKIFPGTVVPDAVALPTEDETVGIYAHTTFFAPGVFTGTVEVEGPSTGTASPE